MVGAFNLKNILGAVGAGLGLGLTSAAISKGVAELAEVPGRLERVRPPQVSGAKRQQASGGGCAVFVDYAHTPDALKNVLETARQLARRRIIVVFGCGGDRDTGKRFPMGEVAGKLADLIVVTSDNSRSESPAAIMAEIEKGVAAAGVTKIDSSAPNAKGYLLIADRSEAIKYAVSQAQKDDVVLLAGKGHENYQITGAKRVFFDDRLEARKQLERLYQQAA
jgi:UDP-N-acetylmuramyl-tripeptide synthetase